MFNTGGFVYIIRGFDLANWTPLEPGACDIPVFLTVEEAQEYCNKNTTKTLVFTYMKARIGKMELSKK